eukprot:GGOE01004310.1.p1 GENE.GGOE01004310.1~~GGOE01004310.1.p1  ORF type:complete len:128 (-),score=0.11 GGOE01004310.1:132-515(-)
MGAMVEAPRLIAPSPFDPSSPSSPSRQPSGRVSGPRVRTLCATLGRCTVPALACLMPEEAGQRWVRLLLLSLTPCHCVMFTCEAPHPTAVHMRANNFGSSNCCCSPEPRHRTMAMSLLHASHAIDGP